MNELRNSKSDDQLEELLLLTEQMQEELDQKDRTIRELKMQLDESLTLNEKRNGIIKKISEYIFERKKRWKRNIMLHWNRQKI